MQVRGDEKKIMEIIFDSSLSWAVLYVSLGSLISVPEVAARRGGTTDLAELLLLRFRMSVSPGWD